MYNRLDEGNAVIDVAAMYFKAMVDADEAELRRIFHPKASVIRQEEGELEFASLDQFIETTPEAKTGDKPFEYRVEELNLVGDTAVISVGGYCYGNWFTDHLSMVKIAGEWKIVSKVFYAHSQEWR